jgi:hypothetical protein
MKDSGIEMASLQQDALTMVCGAERENVQEVYIKDFHIMPSHYNISESQI